eukprot:148304_1
MLFLYVVLLIFIASLTSSVQSIKNGFSFISNDTYWESKSQFTPINGQSYQSIRLGRSLHMKFKFIFKSPTNKQQHYTNGYYENVFRIGNNDSSSDVFGSGSMYPSMWIYYVNHKPYCKFSISNHICNVDFFENSYLLQQNEIYSVDIEFNTQRVFVSISNYSNITYVVVNETRAWTSEDLIGTKMPIFISEFNYEHNPTTPSNITIYDITIRSCDYENRNSKVRCSIEMYATYNETNSTYWMNNTNRMEIYSAFMQEAMLATYENLTGHSMIYEHFDEYTNKQWSFGGILDFEMCILFSETVTAIPGIVLIIGIMCFVKHTLAKNDRNGRKRDEDGSNVSSTESTMDNNENMELMTSVSIHKQQIISSHAQ